MCGIFGFVSPKPKPSDIILDGLKLLEYRGYDSWGIAIKNGTGLSVEKHTGKIGEAQIYLPDTTIGIGHTRWATHGGVTKKNSHPHLDCSGQIAVVHNGIIENWEELKFDLTKKGHKFISETDTEVFPHLVEELSKTNDFESAFRLAFNQIKGLNAVVAINSLTNEIAAAKTGSPLVVGVSDKIYYISSDPSAIAQHTQKALFLKDNEMIILSNSLSLFSLPSGNKLEPEFEALEKNLKDEGLGQFRHFMLKEIYEQPKVLRNIADNFSLPIENLARDIKKAYGTYLIGAGTAYFASLMGTYLFSKIAKVHVNSVLASEFNYLEDFLTNKSLVIALSQSGETIDVVEPLSRAKKKGSKIVAITNVKGSTIYRMADEKILLGAGPERAVASTKAYLAKTAVLLMFSYALKSEVKKGAKIVENTSREIERILSEENLRNLKKIALLLGSKEHTFIIGRGASYPSALEGALKIREVSYLHAEGLAGGELKHGPIALISKGTPVIVFAPNDETYDGVMSNAMEVKARGATIIGISFKNSPVFDHYINVSDISEGSLLAQVVPLQLISYFLALLKNYDPDKPRNLAKSVTVK